MPTPDGATLVWGEANEFAGQAFHLSHLPSVKGSIQLVDQQLVIELGPDPSIKAIKVGDASSTTARLALSAWPVLGDLAIADAFALGGALRVDPKLTLDVECHDGKHVAAPVPPLVLSRTRVSALIRASIPTGLGTLPPPSAAPSTLFLWTKPIVIGPAKRLRDVQLVAVREESGFELSTRSCGGFQNVPGKIPLRRAKATLTVRDLRTGAVARTHTVLGPDTCGTIAERLPDGTWFTQQMPSDAEILKVLARR